MDRRLARKIDARAARRTVPSPTPKAPAIATQERPWRRRWAILTASTNFLGQPSRLPLARAAAKPDRTRCLISLRPRA
jgi:hypothetical protein